LPTSLRRTALACAVIVVSTSACTTRVEGAAVPAPDLTPPTSSPSQPDPVNVPEGFDETPEVQLEPGKPGGTFRVADYEPSTIDPAEAVTGSDVLVTGNLFTGLTVAGPDMKVGPGAAESWEADEDCTTWTFNLKPGGKFHNGEAVTAKSFVAGWKRGAAGSGAGYQMEGVKGYPKVEQGLKTPDDQTLTVALSKPDCEFPVRVAHPVFSPQPKAKFAKRAPVGNGPFQAGRLVAAGRRTHPGPLRRVRHRRQALPGQGRHRADRRPGRRRRGVPEHVRLGPGHGLAAACGAGPARAQGELDLAQRAGLHRPGADGRHPAAEVRRRPQGAVPGHRPRAAVGDRLRRQPATGHRAGVLGVRRRPPARRLLGVPVRPGEGRAAGQGGRPEQAHQAHARVPAAARDADLGQAIREQLEKNLGITVQLQPLPPDKFYERQGKTNARGLYRGAWLPDVATPDDMLRPLLTTRGIANGTNPGRYSNKQFDKLLDRAARTSDEARRAELYQQAEQLAIGTDMALIPLLERTEFRLADNEKFMNLRMDFYENPDLRVISLR